ncbi:MAG TPA: adenylate/guanylate cyclase domain-containing protein [Candidatus Acidoferrales bacterium]|nr:adenylate/guanylate cyclase domain-containing protein [Candidatus Acidoferrales bacterium]
MALPSGTVTFLFTDIEGSTERWERDRPAMQEAVRRHDRIMRNAIETHGGAVFKTVGDAFCAVFARAEDAAAAAIEAQRALFAADFSAVDGIRVRMALNTGTSDEREGDYYGPAVNRVARLLSLGHGGEVLASVTTADLVRETLPAGTTLVDLGRHRLKDIAEPEWVHRLSPAGLPQKFPPLRSPEARPTNLPRQLTSFIGREHELANARELFGGTDLLTLTGFGGIGKTRLALQLASSVADRFTDGTWFVDLAPIADDRFISATVLAAMSVREEPGRDTTDTLAEHLREKSALLVFDNCEHVIDGAARLVDRLLQACPNVKVVATSREVLDVPGELVLRVSTLDEEEAISLFAARAKSAVPSFTISSENRGAVERICRRLDGIALAIELAAARVKTMPIDELWKRLDDSLAGLGGGSRTALPRHQTLRGLIEWSYNLLPEAERAALRRLAVFAGDFSIESASAACVGDPIREAEVLDLLARLVDKSLVQFDTEGTRRYRLLESTKAFAAERLGEAGELETAEDAHARYFQNQARGAIANFATAAYEDVRASIAGDYAEHRAILQRDLVEKKNVVRAAELAASLGYYWAERGHAREGRFWLERSIEYDAELPDETRALAWLGLSRQYYLQGEIEKLSAAAQRALEIYTRLGHARGLANARNQIATADYRSGRVDEAMDLWRQNLAAAAELADTRVEAVALTNLAIAASEMKSDYAMAAEYLHRAVALLRERGDTAGLAVSLNSLGVIAAYQGRFGDAERYCLESLSLFRSIGEETRIIAQLLTIAENRIWAERAEDAREPLREALDRLRPLSHPWFTDYCVDVTAQFAVGSGRLEDAAALFGFVEAYRPLHRLAPPRNPAKEKAVASVRAALGEETFARAQATGRAFTAETALDRVTDLLE